MFLGRHQSWELWRTIPFDLETTCTLVMSMSCHTYHTYHRKYLSNASAFDEIKKDVFG